MQKLITFSLVLFVLIGNLFSQTDTISRKVKAQKSDFGGTNEQTFNFTGEIYYLPKGTNKLPNFKSLTPVGNIFTKKLNIKKQAFDKGFPGVTNRFEYFAIRYKGNFYLEKADTLCFILGSDDGSRLFIDSSLVIDNDGHHALIYIRKCKYLSKGMHSIEVQYFQGPRYEVALSLFYRKKNEKHPKVFDLTEFYPIKIDEKDDLINIEISDQILFAYNSSDLSDDAKHALSEIKRVLMNQLEFKKIIINGHTDDTGSQESNLKLSKNRANAVKSFFMKSGISSGKLVTKGYGESKPKYPNTNEHNQSKNRRIEMVILKR